MTLNACSVPIPQATEHCPFESHMIDMTALAVLSQTVVLVGALVIAEVRPRDRRVMCAALASLVGIAVTVLATREAWSRIQEAPIKEVIANYGSPDELLVGTGFEDYTGDELITKLKSSRKFIFSVMTFFGAYILTAIICLPPAICGCCPRRDPKTD